MKRLTTRDESGYYHLRRGPNGGEINKITVVQHLGRLEDVALRPVSRERVERIWFREPYTRLETKCGENGDVVYSAVNTCMACGHETPIGNFCHNCGAAQTRGAVEMVMRRLEALKDGKDCSI